MTKRHHRTITSRAAAAALASAILSSGAACAPVQTEVVTADEAAVELSPDNAWVSVSGTVIATGDTTFALDYGAGVITVEMDDWDWYPEARDLVVNDDVIVYGYIDDDFLEARTIEASSVYVEDLGTQFYASGVDEEDLPVATVVEIDPRIEVTGTVTAISGDEFSLDTGAGTIDVNTEPMLYDPLDAEGYQQITVGDRVRVTGQIEEELFSDYDLMADTITSLKPTSSGESS